MVRAIRIWRNANARSCPRGHAAGDGRFSDGRARQAAHWASNSTTVSCVSGPSDCGCRFRAIVSCARRTRNRRTNRNSSVTASPRPRAAATRQQHRRVVHAVTGALDRQCARLLCREALWLAFRFPCTVRGRSCPPRQRSFHDACARCCARLQDLSRFLCRLHRRN
jgi:hypothetical protein